MKLKKAHWIIIHFLVLDSLCVMSNAHKVYFADGYHGGIYGHYPISWKTKFIVDQFHQHPEWKISLEIEPETWDSVRRNTPEHYYQLQNIITDNRIEITNPTYAQPYCYNISGESIIRQFEYGIKKTKEHFPDVQFSTYSAEEPCFTSSLPQILNGFGYKYAVLKCPNTCWGGYTRAYGGELVNWIGPDGSSILTSPRYAVEELEDNSTWQTKAWANSSEYLDACFNYGIKNPIGMCFQDAGWKNGPWLGFGDKVKNKSIYVTWKEYFENISIGNTEDNLNFSQEDMLVNLMWGTQVMQKLSREVRSAENNIVKAEKMAGMSFIINKNTYDADRFQEAWRTLMLAQHHDSWIVPYNRLNKYRNWAEEITIWTDNTNNIADDAINGALNSIHKTTKKNNTSGFFRVYNAQGQKRSELVKVKLPANYEGVEFKIIDIHKKNIPYFLENENNQLWIGFIADVPAFGYATYKIEKGKTVFQKAPKIQYLNQDEFLFENKMYKIIFDVSKGGTIKSLILKSDNKEFVKNDNEYLLGELRGYFYEDKKFYSSKDTPAKITTILNNSNITKILIEGEIANHPFKQLVTIANNQRNIDFDLQIDWKHNVGIGEYEQKDNWRDNRRAFCDNRYKLNVLLPVNLGKTKLYKNAPFDVCESKLDNTHFGSWDAIKHNVILNWVDVVDKDDKYGFTLLTDHTTSYSHGEDFPLALTVQYSGIGLWGWNYKISGSSNIKYAIIPHTNKWDKADIAEESVNWNEKLIATFVTDIDFENKSFIDIEKSGYEISSVQVVNNSLLLRLFNASGNDNEQQINLNFPLSEISEVDLNNNSIQNIKPLKTDVANTFYVKMPRFGLKTYLIK